MKVSTTVTTEIEVTPEQLGEWFANLDDDAMARFFVAAAKVATGWKNPNMGWEWQFYACGSHLRNCKCSTDDARELVRNLAHGLESGSH